MPSASARQNIPSLMVGRQQRMAEKIENEKLLVTDVAKRFLLFAGKVEAFFIFIHQFSADTSTSTTTLIVLRCVQGQSCKPASRDQDQAAADLRVGYSAASPRSAAERSFIFKVRCAVFLICLATDPSRSSANRRKEPRK